MRSELITTWSGNDEAVSDILRLAKTSLRIFDDDLLRLKLESRENAERLERFLCADRQHSIHLVLKQTTPLRRECPRLLRLLATYPQQMHAFEDTQNASGNTRNIDSLILADDCHALIRFAKDQPRARLIVDSAADCASYADQFALLLNSCGEPISMTILGL